MNKSVIILVAALLAVLALETGCSPFTKVYAEEEPGINLHKYHTFNWLSNETSHQGNSGPEWLTSATQEKIRASVESEMMKYGFKPCDENPDLMLHYHVVIKNEVLYERDWRCGAPGGEGGVYNRCNRLQPVHYQEGTLIIDIIDTKSGVQVWRGAAVSILNNLKAGEVDARIKEAIKVIFKKFPEKPRDIA